MVQWFLFEEVDRISFAAADESMQLVVNSLKLANSLQSTPKLTFTANLNFVLKHLIGHRHHSNQQESPKFDPELVESATNSNVSIHS